MFRTTAWDIDSKQEKSKNDKHQTHTYQWREKMYSKEKEGEMPRATSLKDVRKIEFQAKISLSSSPDSNMWYA